MPRIALVVTVLVQNPPSVRRPARAEVKMIRVSDNAHAIRAIGIARPNLVPTRARKMKRHTPPIRAETQAIGQPFTRARELTSVGAIEVHAENLPDLVPHDLHEHAVITDKQRG